MLFDDIIISDETMQKVLEEPMVELKASDGSDLIITGNSVDNGDVVRKNGIHLMSISDVTTMVNNDDNTELLLCIRGTPRQILQSLVDTAYEMVEEKRSSNLSNAMVMISRTNTICRLSEYQACRAVR